MISSMFGSTRETSVADSIKLYIALISSSVRGIAFISSPPDIYHVGMVAFFISS